MNRLIVLTLMLPAIFCLEVNAGGPEVPSEAFTIGIMRFFQEGNSNISSFLEFELRSHGYRIIILPENSDSPLNLLERNPKLDFLITGAISGDINKTYIAKVYVQGQKRHQNFQSNEGVSEISFLVVSHIFVESTRGVLERKKTRALNALRRNPNDSESLTLLGLAYYSEGLAYYHIGKKKHGEGKIDSAIATFKKALEINPNESSLHYDLYLCYKQKNQAQKQEEHLKLAIENDPHDENVNIALGNKYFRKGQYAEAVGIYTKLLESPKSASIAHYNLALVYMQNNNRVKAREHLKVIPKTDPLFEKSSQLLYILDEEELNYSVIKIVLIVFSFMTIIFCFHIIRKRWVASRNKGRLKAQLSNFISLPTSNPIDQEKYKIIKILFLAANPSDTTQLNLDKEIRAIDEKLRQADYRDMFDIKQHWAVRVSDLQGIFLRHRPNIVHFSGHGSLSSEIILEDDLGNSHPVSTNGLSKLFAILKNDIRCVVLNACYSEIQARTIAEHVDYVIGMSKAITDHSAISFAAAFYQALGYGRDVRTAFDLGCTQIDLENFDEQDIPKLITLRSHLKSPIALKE